MKNRLLLVWLWLIAIPALLVFDLALGNLMAWTSGVQGALEVRARDHAPEGEFLREGIYLSWIALRWLTFGTVLFAIVKTVRSLPKRGNPRATAV